MSDAEKNAKSLAEFYLKTYQALKSIDKAISLGAEAVNIADDIFKTKTDKYWIDKCVNMLGWTMTNIRVEFDSFTQLIGDPAAIAVEHNSSMGELQQSLILLKKEILENFNG